MRFGGIVAVNDSVVHRERNKITALIGPNGAGKTTVFNCITGFYKPSAGNRSASRMMTAHNSSLQKLNDFRISKVAKVARTFQNIRLFPGMTALENLMVAQHNALMRASGFTFLGPVRRALLPRRRTGRHRSRHAHGLKRIGLLERADDAAGNLPYGDQRRLEIARAMCTEPALLCLDEPAAGLNAARVRPERDPRESAALSELRSHAARLRHQDRRQARHKFDPKVSLIEHDDMSPSKRMEISDPTYRGP